MFISSLGRCKDGSAIKTPSVHRMEGYCSIKIDGEEFKVHQLQATIWDLPRGPGQNTVDHKNRIRSDNNIVNLRYASTAEQNQNQDRPESCNSAKGAKEVFNLPGEEWKRLNNSIKAPLISNFGRMRRHQNNYKYSYTPAKNTNIEGKEYQMSRLVAILFCPTPSNFVDDWKKWQVIHLDRDSNNNKASNLKWMYRKDAIAFNKQIIYNENVNKIAIEARRLNSNDEWTTYESATNAAKALNANQAMITAVCKGRRNHHHGFDFRYKKIEDLPNEEWRAVTPEACRKAKQIASGDWDKLQAVMNDLLDAVVANVEN